MKHFVVLVLFLVLIFGCNNPKKEYTAIEKQTEINNHPGKKLMETNCYTCHNPPASHDDRIGPPMVAIKKHYIDNNTTKEEFTKSIQDWIKNPSEENAKMFGAVKRFGVMPKLAFSEETIKEITDYMYNFDIEQPEWFDDHFNKKKGKHNGKKQRQSIQKQQAKVHFDILPYEERGLKYALTTKAVLEKNLMGTIQQKGTIEALTFCNEKAYPLTDSMSIVHNATIKRVSDKPRNQNNLANNKELTYINSFKNDIKNNKEPKPIVNELDNKVHVYYPIVTNTMCLQCHGKPNQNIQKPTLKKLTNLYPKDKAIGYGINEVRGIWSITFDK